MDRAGRFGELFKVLGPSPDPVRIPAMMRFGGFGEKDSYLVESAVRLSPEAFGESISSPDAEKALEAADEIGIPGIVPIVSDMRRARGLQGLRVARRDADRRALFGDMFSDLGRGSLVDGSMRRRGFRPEDVLMVRYIARCCRKDLEAMAWDPDPETAVRAAESIADATSLDRAAVISLMEDIRGDAAEEAPEPPDPGLVFKKHRPSEARLVRYVGSESRVRIPEEAVVNGMRLRVTSISDNAFARNVSLEEIDMADGITSIGRYAFFGCSALREVSLPKDLKSVGLGAFCRCSSLESVDLPQGLERIEDQAFLGCPMEEAFVPETVSSVGRHSFPPTTDVKGRGARRKHE
jgi:hypothetical protein